MRTASEIIELCGGTSALADSLRLTPSTVSSWKATNHIPRWWHHPILAVAKANGQEINAADFPQKPSRSSKVAA